MKIDIIFKLAYLCFLIGTINADDNSDLTDNKSNTTVPSVANNSTEDLNNTSTNSTINKDEEVTSAPNDTSTSSVPTSEPTSLKIPTPSPTPNATTTNATESQATEKTDSTESENIATTHLSTGESNPTASPSKAGSGGFNALSFIGGIVFTVGILAIMYVGFKFYKSRTERNYHTL